MASDTELWSLATDTVAPALARTCAMLAVAQGGLNPSKQATLTKLAMQPDQRLQLRAGGIIALHAAGKPLPRLTNAPVLERLVTRLGH